MLPNVPRWVWYVLGGVVLVVVLVRLARGLETGDGASLIARIFLFAGFLLGLSFIPHIPGRRFLVGVSVAILVLGLVSVLFSRELSKVAPKALSDSASGVKSSEFTLDAGEEKRTVETYLGSVHQISSNKPFLILAEKGGKPIDYRFPDDFPAGTWKGGDIGGQLLIKGLEDDTIIRFRKIR